LVLQIIAPYKGFSGLCREDDVFWLPPDHMKIPGLADLPNFI